jgi:hypothetical protein
MASIVKMVVLCAVMVVPIALADYYVFGVLLGMNLGRLGVFTFFPATILELTMFAIGYSFGAGW